MRHARIFFGLIMVFLFSFLPTHAQQPNIRWSRAYGGSILGEQGECVIETRDGGFVITGSCENSAQERKLMLMKTDENGDVVWFHHPADVEFGGTGRAVVQTADGGFIVTGYIYAIGNDRNLFLMKTDSLGHQEWFRGFGGAELDEGYGVQQTTDGGYLVVGMTSSSGEGDEDLWLIKTDADGNQEWNLTYGGDHADRGTAIKHTSDGGFIITGFYSQDDFRRSEFLLLKLSADYAVEWAHVFGREGYYDSGRDVIQLADGGYAITGYSMDTSESQSTVILMKFDAGGELIWDKYFLTSQAIFEYGHSLVEDQNGAFTLSCSTDPGFIGSVPRAWIMKVDPVGNTVWQYDYEEFPHSGCRGSSIVRTQDGGYAIAGTMAFRRGHYHFNRDVALVRLESDTSRFLISMIPPQQQIIFPEEGGFFRFDGIVFNSLAAPQLGQVWATVTTPDNQVFSGPPMPFFHVMFQPGEPVYRLNMQQNVPAYAPEGYYTYTLCVGIYPNHVLSESSLEFRKLNFVTVDPAADKDPASGWGWDTPEVVSESVDDYQLLSVYPNPFNAATTVTVTLPDASDLSLVVYNTLGQQVAELFHGTVVAGQHTFTFDGSDLASGVYFLQLHSTQGSSELSKLVLMK
ncbi:T9SS type A sorting domain-containing protein [bacterium]|nr:T9SS type A sorting domain-containing protein [bacterium]